MIPNLFAKSECFRSNEYPSCCSLKLNLSMPITLEIRGMRSSDVASLQTWQPSSLADVFYPLELDLCEPGSVGSEVFVAVICTPESLKKHALECQRLNVPFPDRNLLGPVNTTSCAGPPQSKP